MTSLMAAWRSGRGPRPGMTDVLLGVGVLVVLALLVLRVPPALLDALLAVSLVSGVALLLLAIYIPHPVAFNSFPSVLLISTLFRLALSVATTRLILIDAHAGQIVEAFGSFVAGGNLVVGIVVFIIITAVQFIVIAKGAERVAEVGARFTLDAMPGKQMSIDSDLRSGLIDKDEAKRRRRHVEQESQLNGALDGAMKFVKGDAIASIIIVIVNLIGGLAIGVAQRGMSFADAAHVYSILSIGDGMVAQVPALMSAMAAGLVVTRTSGDSGDRHLGATIVRQVLTQPRPLVVTGVTALVLAAVPGFPPLAFLLLAAGLLLAAWLVARGRIGAEGGGASSHALVTAQQAASGAEPLLLIRHGSDAHALARQIGTRLGSAAAALGDELGIAIPMPLVRSDAALPAAACRVNFFDVVVAEVDAKTDLDALGRSFERELRRQAAHFLGVQETSDLLQRVALAQPALAKEIGAVMPVQQLADILRRLLSESLPVRNLRDILEALLHWVGKEKDPAGLAEFARVGIGRWITARHADADGRLHAILVDHEIETELRAGCKPVAGTVLMTLAPDRAARIQQRLRAQIETATQTSPRFVLLTAIDVRRHVRKLLESSHPQLAVLSYQELVEPLTLVALGDAGNTAPRLVS
jgi:type III secretion protein V